MGASGERRMLDDNEWEGDEVMKWSKLMRTACQGFHEAAEAGLAQEENWTPLLVWIHCSRLALGFALGMIAGGCLALAIWAICYGLFCP